MLSERPLQIDRLGQRARLRDRIGDAPGHVRLDARQNVEVLQCHPVEILDLNPVELGASEPRLDHQQIVLGHIPVLEARANHIVHRPDDLLIADRGL